MLPVYCVKCKTPLSPTDDYCAKCGMLQKQPPPIVNPPQAPTAQAQLSRPVYYTPPPVYVQPTAYAPQKTGCLGALLTFLSASAELLQVLWTVLCLFCGGVMLFVFGFFGALTAFIIWFAVWGVLGVFKNAARR